jgi:uncharacterized protein
LQAAYSRNIPANWTLFGYIVAEGEPSAMGDMKDDAGMSMKERLHADLRIALKKARASEVKVIRALITALDDAEAPPLQAGTGAAEHRFSAGSAEFQCRLLSGEDVRCVLLADIAERERAAAELKSVGKVDSAEALRLEALVARQYLEP